MLGRRFFLFLFSVISAPLMLSAADWPQWRGPDRDGVWREGQVVTELPTGGPELIWSTPVAAGYSAPIVAGNRVYLTDKVDEPAEQERIHAFDRSTGERIWTHAYECVYFDISYPLGPRAGITVHEGRVYAMGAMGHFHCLEAETGEVIWSRDLVEDFAVNTPVWGMTSSPLVDPENDLVILQIGGQPDACVVALNLEDGAEVWRSLDGLASYSSPRFVQQGKERVVLVWTADWFAGLNPKNGDIFWKDDFPRKKGPIAVPDPVLDETHERVYLTSFYDGSHLYRLHQDKPGIDVIWRRVGRSERHTEALHSMITTPTIQGNFAYGMDSYGEFRCIDLSNGDRVWSDQTLLENGRWGTAFITRAKADTWIFTERGELFVTELTPAGFTRPEGRQIIEPTTFLPRRNGNVLWSHPAYAEGHIFVRNDRELRCLDLR